MDKESEKLFHEHDMWDARQRAYEQAKMMAQDAQTVSAQNVPQNQYNNHGLLGGAAVLGGMGGFAATKATPPYSLREKLSVRLNVGRHDSMPFQFIEAVENHEGGNVTIFIIQGGKAVTLEDDLNLFPSDRLISQLNLIRT